MLRFRAPLFGIASQTLSPDARRANVIEWKGIRKMRFNEIDEDLLSLLRDVFLTNSSPLNDAGLTFGARFFEGAGSGLSYEVPERHLHRPLREEPHLQAGRMSAWTCGRTD